MAVPAYQEFFPYILRLLEDKKEYKLSDIRKELVKTMNLTEKDLEELLPSKTQTVFQNRANWACFYLKKAGILSTPQRGIYVLTSIEEQIIKGKGYDINTEDLLQYESFREFVNVDKKEEDKIDNEETDRNLDVTPEARIDEAFKTLHIQLSEEILSEIMEMSPIFFERMVLDLLYEMGYGGKDKNRIIHTRFTQDDGIDGLIKEDELGLDYIYIQAKRWSGVVGQPEIQKFAGALSGKGARKGIFITTSWFSKQAIQYADNHQLSRIILIDGDKLSNLMIIYGVGLSTHYIYKLQKIDKDYYTED